jgi:hypothetical protein
MTTNVNTNNNNEDLVFIIFKYLLIAYGFFLASSIPCYLIGKLIGFNGHYPVSGIAFFFLFFIYELVGLVGHSQKPMNPILFILLFLPSAAVVSTALIKFDRYRNGKNDTTPTREKYNKSVRKAYRKYVDISEQNGVPLGFEPLSLNEFNKITKTDNIARKPRVKRQIRTPHERPRIIIAPTRSGKTTCIVIPAILDAPGPVVATSSKTDLLDILNRFPDIRKRIVIFDPLDIVADVSVPRLLWDITQNADDAEIARARAEGLVQFGMGTAQNITNGDYWKSAATNIIAGLFLGLEKLKKQTEINIPLDVLFLSLAGSGEDDTRANALIKKAANNTKLVAMKNLNNDNDMPFLEKIITVLEDGYPAYASAVNELNTQRKSRNYERVPEISVARNVITLLNEQKIKKAIDKGVFDELKQQYQSVSIFNPEEFIFSDKILLLITEAENKSVCAVITAMINELITVIKRTANEYQNGKRSVNDKKMKIVSFILDELANVAPIPDLDKLMATIGGLGVSLTGVIQNSAQLEQVYGKGGKDTVLANAVGGELVLAGVRSIEDLERYERLAGQVTIKKQSTQLDKSKQESGTTESYDKESLVTAGHIRMLKRYEKIKKDGTSEFYGTEALLYVGSDPALPVIAIPYWNIQRYKMMMSVDNNNNNNNNN